MSGRNIMYSMYSIVKQMCCECSAFDTCKYTLYPEQFYKEKSMIVEIGVHTFHDYYAA